jgi:CBS domain-containing protein
VGWIDQRGSEVLSRNECLRLMAVHAGGVGRIGFVDSGHAVIEPVNYRMVDNDVAVQVGPGSMLEAAERHAIISFEVDWAEPPEAWSVVVRGPTHTARPDTVIDDAQPAGARPLVPQPGASYFVIRTDVVSGRRFPLSHATALGRRADSRGLADVQLRPPVGLPRDATIREAAAAMEEEQISSVLVGEHPAWLVSEHDLIGALAAGLGPGDPAGDVATRTPLWATTSTTLTDAAAMMAKHCVQHLVVITPDGTPVGVLSRREVLRQLLADAEVLRADPT